MGGIEDVNQAPRQYGVTKPLSTAGPTEVDLQRGVELERFLVDAGLYESQEEAVKREEVLGQIDQVVKAWVKQLTSQRGYSDQMVEDANAVIFTFGSYRLGVHGPGADIDTLCVGPSYVNREEDFFIILHDILSEMEEVSELQPVPDAHVPVMKFKFNGISIDLLYASVSLLVVPEDLDISQGSVLYDVDEPTVRSLNGCRVVDQILRLVPSVENFRTTLRCLKLWAKRRGVYSNIERDTYEMLQCHPYPYEYVDASKQCSHCAFFMGLQRKQGVRVQEGQQFDIRGTVDEFRHSVNMYMYWKPGMEIYVSHVRRKQIPSFVFPDGFKQSRPSKVTSQQKFDKVEGQGTGVKCGTGSSERKLKKRRSPDGRIENHRIEKRASNSPESEKLSSPEGGSAGSSGGSVRVVCSPDIVRSPLAEVGESSLGSRNQIASGSAAGIYEAEHFSCGGVIISEPSSEVTLRSCAIAKSCEGISCEISDRGSLLGTVLKMPLLESDQVSDNGSAADSEPNASLGAALKSRGGISSESMQKPAIRLSLTTTV